MNFPRTLQAPGTLCVLLILGGCSSLDTSAPAPNGRAANSNQQVVALSSPSSSEAGSAEKSPAASPVAESVDSKVASLSAPSATKREPGRLPEPEFDNLWDRLNAGYRLSNLEDAPARLAQFEKWYSDRPAYFDRLAERAYWFLPYIVEEVEKRGMPTEIALLPTIESAFRPDATSRSGAVGLWQFIASTGRRFGLRQDWWMEGRRDLVQSTRAALDYLDFLSREFDGDWELALAAYNAGEGTIRRQIKINNHQNRPTSYAALHLRRETAEYVPRLLAVRNILRDPERFGISLKPLPNHQTLVAVDVRTQTDLVVAASLSGMSADKLMYFNMGYRRGVTPPNGPHTLMVPVERSSDLLVALGKLSHDQRMRWARHQVRKGEYLGMIAKQHGVTVNSIMQTNRLDSNLIHPGQALRIPLSSGNVQFADNVFSSGGASRTYRVRRGDSLWSISRRHGISVARLASLNGISQSSLLQPGQALLVSR